MRNLVVTYTKSDIEKDTPDLSTDQKKGYELFAAVCREYGWNYYRTSREHWQGGYFTAAWTHDGQSWQRLSEQQIAPDMVFPRVRTSADGWSLDMAEIAALYDYERHSRLVNNVEFAILADSKLQQSAALAAFQAETIYWPKGTKFTVEAERSWLRKPLYGSGGKGVELLPVGEHIAEETAVVQRFVEFADANGIRRDYRFQVVGGQVVQIYSRTAARGDILTNVAAGGSAQFLPLSEAERFRPTLEAVTAILSHFGRNLIYCIDIMEEAATGKHYVIEINSAPGMNVSAGESTSEWRYYYQKMLDLISVA